MRTAGSLARRDLGLLVVGRVVVRREGRELGRAGVDRLVDRAHARARAAPRGRRPRACRAASPICASLKPCRFARRSSVAGRARPASRTLVGDLVDQHDLVEEPRVDARRLVAPARRWRRRAAPAARRRAARRWAARRSHAARRRRRRARRPSGTAVALLDRAQRLLQRLGEVAADRHGLADRLHRGGQRRVGRRELLEREPRHLDHDVVQRRLEATPASPG